MARLSRITTRNGDKGKTHLANGDVVSKNNQRIVCLGDQDELLAALGLLITQLQQDVADNLLVEMRHVQQKLFDFGAELSLPGHVCLTSDDVKWLEDRISKLNDPLPPLKEFVLPGPPEGAARAHLCRTICRRLERACFRLDAKEAMNPVALQWINRLSDFLFVLSRTVVHQQGETEPMWHGVPAD